MDNVFVEGAGGKREKVKGNPEGSILSMVSNEQMDDLARQMPYFGDPTKAESWMDWLDKHPPAQGLILLAKFLAVMGGEFQTQVLITDGLVQPKWTARGIAQLGDLLARIAKFNTTPIGLIVESLGDFRSHTNPQVLMAQAEALHAHMQKLKKGGA